MSAEVSLKISWKSIEKLLKQKVMQTTKTQLWTNFKTWSIKNIDWYRANRSCSKISNEKNPKNPILLPKMIEISY